MPTKLEEKISEIAIPFLKREGLTLYDIDIAGGERKPLLRVYIDKEGGVRHDDCVNVSRHLSTVIDVEEIIRGTYNIEVSSPGLTRALKKPVHFEKSVGLLAKVTFRKSFAHSGTVIGRLKKASGDNFLIEPEEGKPVEFSFNDVAKARLEFEE